MSHPACIGPYIHDHLTNAIGLQKVSCLCLLDLSAAFDTINHNILIIHLSSWFGIHGSVLSWFKSYLSSRSLHVKCDNNLSSFHTSSCGVFQGSVLGPLLFVMYTTPLSTWSLRFPLTTTFTQMILSSSSLFTHSTLTQAFLTFKTLFNRHLPGWLLIFLLLTLLRLNSCSSNSKINLPKYTTLHLPPLTLLDILASSLTNILLLWPNYISLQSLLLSYSSASLYLDLPRFLNYRYHCYLYFSLQTWLL